METKICSVYDKTVFSDGGSLPVIIPIYQAFCPFWFPGFARSISLISERKK